MKQKGCQNKSEKKFSPPYFAKHISSWNNYIILQHIRHKQSDPELCDLIMLINHAERDSH